MLPSDMNLKIRSGIVGYNNKILISDEKFNLVKNVEVNSLALEPVIPMPKGHPSHKAKQTQAKKPNISHNDEKIALVLALAGGFTIRNMFRSIP